MIPIGDYDNLKSVTDFFSGNSSVSIGDVSIKIRTPKSPELVPTNYCKYVLWSMSPHLFLHKIIGCRACLSKVRPPSKSVYGKCS